MDLIVQTNNMVETKRGSFGVCISMCTYWIKASQKFGGVTKTWQIGQTGSFRIRQAAGMIGQQRGDENIIKNAGLTIQNSSLKANYAQLGQGLSANGYHIFTLWNNAFTEGHAMGSWSSPSGLQFFDPNFGLFTVASAGAMAGDVQTHCLTYYPGLQAACRLYNVS